MKKAFITILFCWISCSAFCQEIHIQKNIDMMAFSRKPSKNMYAVSDIMPIGWSKDGKFAFVHKRSVAGRGGVTFSHPGGRGSSANASMRFTTRCRRFFWGIASISRPADGLMRILYLATAFQVLHDLFKREIGLGCPFLEGGQIFSVLSQGSLDGVVYQLGDRPIRLCRLQAQGAVDQRVEVDGATFGGSGHALNIAR